MLNVIMLSVIMLIVIMMIVIMLGVIALSVIMLNVFMISVIMLSVITLKVTAPMFLSSKSLARQQKMAPRLWCESHFPEGCFPPKRCQENK
jgi:hypothetical protein